MGRVVVVYGCCCRRTWVTIPRLWTILEISSGCEPKCAGAGVAVHCLGLPAPVLGSARKSRGIRCGAARVKTRHKVGLCAVVRHGCTSSPKPGVDPTACISMAFRSQQHQTTMTRLGLQCIKYENSISSLRECLHDGRPTAYCTYSANAVPEAASKEKAGCSRKWLTRMGAPERHRGPGS